MVNTEQLYELWLERAVDDPDIKAELLSMKGDEKAIYECFYRELEFGTGGLRGVIGAGSFRMNVYTICRATQGLANYIKGKCKNPSVAIAYDSRIKSDAFSKAAAEVLAGNGIKVYIYPELMPTPMLSFAVRQLKTDAGIVVTASHNPAKYNGYKVYGSDGCQMTDNDATAVFECIEKVDTFDGVTKTAFEKGIADGMICYIGQEMIDNYLDKVASRSVNPEMLKGCDLKVIYTPLNGAGNMPVRKILDKSGILDVTVVPEQEMPDGSFPTIPFPNPEIKQVFEIAIDMAKTLNSDLLLATDPDCDRVGIAVRHAGDYVLMSGNEVGVMLLNYLLEQKGKKETLSKNPIAVKTIVTTPLAALVAQKYNCEIIDVLTGFKYIGEQIGFLEAKGEEERYVFGFEESYGYLAGGYVRDKDAVVSSMLICEMTAFYKKQGKTLIDIMDDLYKEYGYFINSQLSFQFEGSTGMEKMGNIMNRLHESTLRKIGDYEVSVCADYLNSVSTELKSGEKTEITLPKSDVLSYTLKNGASVIVRPSGTEPKLKVYVSSKGETREQAEKLNDVLKDLCTDIIEK